MTDQKIGTEKEQAIFEHLLLNQKFQKAVITFRKKHGVPDVGFNSEEEWLEWSKRQPLHNINIKREIFELDAGDRPKIMNTRIAPLRIAVYHIAIFKILKHFNLSLEWFPFLDRYLGMNDQGKISIYWSTLTRDSYKGVVLREQMSFKFGATLTQKRLVQDPLGGNIWMYSIQPLQAIMQGYSEKDKRPVKSNAKLQDRISKQD